MQFDGANRKSQLKKMNSQRLNSNEQSRDHQNLSTSASASSYVMGIALGVLSSGMTLAIVTAFWLTSLKQTTTTAGE